MRIYLQHPLRLTLPQGCRGCATAPADSQEIWLVVVKGPANNPPSFKLVGYDLMSLL